MILTPIHQFEIRYTDILNFPNVVRTVVAPFVKLAKRISVENEGSHSEKIILYFEDEFYQIMILWDRIIFKCESNNLSSLIHSNSIIEEPFFNLFNKISQLPEFGEVKNVLFFTFYVKMDDDKDFELKKNNFIKQNFISDGYINIVSGINDVGVVIESKEGDDTIINIMAGPYKGYEDITKRNFLLKDQKIIEQLQNTGEIIDYKFFKTTKVVSYSTYKDIFRKAETTIRQKWTK